MHPAAVDLNLQHRGQQPGKRPIKPIVDGVPAFDGVIEGRKIRHDSFVRDRWIVERERPHEEAIPLQCRAHAAALALVVLMTIQGLGYLLPTNLWVCIQLRRPDPDLAKISRTMRNYFFAVGAQGTMQVLTIVIMARFVTGL